ncbi:MAG: respiratory nitrate reductase subunit gamma [Chloroflexi bacterium]|nr:respiratory nitrate reductase subunit gamma [Chloroflexota bacterium]
MIDELLFIAFPYTAAVLAVVMTVVRYRSNRFTYSSLSSQLLENRVLSWASVAWHYAILVILAAHFGATAFPGLWARLLGSRLQLYALEITGMAFALLSIVGMALFMWRRLAYPRIRAVTSVGDWALLVALLVQVILGFLVAFVYRWGSLWYLQTATPWLESLVRLNPQIAPVVPLPWLIKLHFAGGFVILALLPFTRLIHAVTLPIGYLWRPYQVVIWNRRRA